MADKTQCCAEKLYLWHPETLSTEGIVNILLQRSVPYSAIIGLSKDELLNIYRMNFMPLPQREFTELNKHGQIVRKRQIEIDKEKKWNINAGESPLIKQARMNPAFTRLSSSSNPSLDQKIYSSTPYRQQNNHHINLDEIVIKKFDFKTQDSCVNNRMKRHLDSGNSDEKPMKLRRPNCDISTGNSNTRHPNSAENHGAPVETVNKRFESFPVPMKQNIQINSSTAEPFKKRPKLTQICWP